MCIHNIYEALKIEITLVRKDSHFTLTRTMKWRNYSVFISSTFTDMHSERDYLQMYVFPEINKELKKYSISLRIIDLRWGVDTLGENPESIEEKVMRVCFDEIDRSRPFFIGLLGNRYGWEPSNSNNTFHQNKGISKAGSITSMEIEYGFFLQKNKNGCLFMERCASSLNAMDEETREHYDDAYSGNKKIKTENPIKLKELKDKIQIQLAESGHKECYQKYCPTWNGKKFEDLEEFGNIVKNAIIKYVESIFVENQYNKPYSLEQTIQEEYFHTKLSRAYPRPAVKNKLIGMIENNTGLLAISGPSGSGKSCIYTLLADHFRQLSDDYIVLIHSTAANRESREYERMLQRWNHSLEEAFNLPHKETISANDTITYFSHLIKKTPNGKKLLMFVDAIDGFNRNAVTEHLSFYPRSLSEKWLMVCTCLPKCTEKIESYHRTTVEFPLPVLEHDEATEIIKNFTKFYCKELSSENLTKLMQKSAGNTPCYSSPLWLTIALLRIINFNENDFTQIALLNEAFDKGIVQFINRQITTFPEQENKLMSDYLQQLDEVYDGIPSQIFKILSASYDGLNEDTMAALMGDKWSALKFATIKSFLREFIVEQSGSKSWKIMHDKCKTHSNETEHEEICSELAQYYIEQIEDGKIINDNICYYLIQCKDNHLARRYFSLFQQHRSRINQELIQICDIAENKSILEFLFAAFTQKWGFRKYLPDFFLYWHLKEVVTNIAKHFNKVGKYENTITIMDTFYHFIENKRFNNDIKTIIFIITEPELDTAVTSICNNEERRKAYMNALERAKIKGPISLTLAPIARKYYQWKIFNLKTN